MKTRGLGASIYLAVMIIGMIVLTGCAGGGKETPSANHFEAGGVSFDYPGTWETVSPSSQYAIVTIADSQVKTIWIAVEKRAIPAGYTLKGFNDELVIGMKPAQVISGTFPTIAGVTACETVFKTDDSQVKVVNLEKDGNMYTILCSAPATAFANAQTSFNKVINSFKFQ